MTDITIGIDISKALLDVATKPAGSDSGEFKQFPNNKKGHKTLVKWLGTFKVKLIVFEATGAYHRGLERFLAERGLPYFKCNPCRVRNFAKSVGKLAKTDRIDSLMLARFGELVQPPHSVIKSQAVEELGEMMVARNGLIKDRTRTNNRLHNLVLPLLKRQAKRHLKQIAADIKAIDAACRALVKADEGLRHRFDILTSISGVGKITAIVMLAQMPELGTMDKRQVASLAGLAPITRQSGKWQGKSFIQGGRKPLRQALYMPALVACRFNPQLKVKYQAMVDASKPKKVAITAIMRKLIIIANALIRDNRKWTEFTA
jgi:transposase